MLVLSRKKNESIVIDNQITITVIDVRGDKVRLGIAAPRDVSVHRGEIQEIINKQAEAVQEVTLTVNPAQPITAP